MFFWWVTLVLFIALTLYVILGGADFGAGILEIFTLKDQSDEAAQITHQAMGPVWEANHIWIIIVVVILLYGFPETYATISTYLFIPVTLMLVGIVFRGTAFMYRHYDAIQDHSQRYYTAVFAVASLLTPFFLGITAGAIILGRITTNPADFYTGFIAPWLNAFCLAMGLFVCCICTFLASIFLIGEPVNSEFRLRFRRQAVITNVATVAAGGLVFLTAQLNGFPLLRLFLSTPISLASIILATLSLPVLWVLINRGHDTAIRIAAGFQVAMILIGWLAVQYPATVNLQGDEAITLFSSRAPDASLTALGWALIAGVLIIFPALFYLLQTFKLQKNLPGI